MVKIFMGPDVGELLKGMRPRVRPRDLVQTSEFPRGKQRNVFVGLGFKGKEADGARD